MNQQALLSSTRFWQPLLPAILLACLSVPAFSASPTSPATSPVTITVTKAGCSPASLTVMPGKTSFQIKNESGRALEWEILKGVNVVEERENMLPGFVTNLTATLDAGEYQMTCGLLSNPKGVITVSAGEGSGATVTGADLAAPIAAYKVYVSGEVNTLVERTRVLVEAVKAGNVEAAQVAYAPAHRPYERIEPIAELFNDLDSAMDAREDDFEKKAEDPNFTGFHRIEKAVFADRSTAGMDQVADKLMADTLDLQKRLVDLTITPKTMVGGAADLIEEVASKKISGEEDRYSRTDLWDFAANVEGAQKIVSLLRPLMERHDPSLDARVRANFTKVEALLSKYRTGSDGFLSYEKLADQDRNGLKGPITLLAEDLSTLRGTLGLN